MILMFMQNQCNLYSIFQENRLYLFNYYSSETYKKEILLPVVRSLARKADAKEFLEMNIDETGPIILPKGVSELQSKHNQVKTFKTFTFKVQTLSLRYRKYWKKLKYQ
jgi:hypothetical protein